MHRSQSAGCYLLYLYVKGTQAHSKTLLSKHILQYCLMHMSFLTLCTLTGNTSGCYRSLIRCTTGNLACPTNKQGAPVPRLGTCLQYKADDLNNSLPQKHTLVFLDIQPNKKRILYLCEQSASSGQPHAKAAFTVQSNNPVEPIHQQSPSNCYCND